MAGLTAFLVLAGTGIAAAVWTAAPAPLTGTVSAARFAVTISPADIAKLNVTYSPSARSFTSAISVVNTGDIAASYTVSIKAPANGLADNTVLTGWIPASGSNCSVAPVAGQSLSGILSSGLSSPPVNLAVGAVNTFCVRTTIKDVYVTTVGAPSIPTVTLSYTQGSWSRSATATATQIVADTLAPSAPGTPVASGTTAAKTTLTWGASNDNVGVASYDIYRDGNFLRNVSPTTLTFTDTGLTGGTAYVYAVKARDAAGNVSAASAAQSVTTTPFDTLVNYRVTSSSSGLCIDGGVSPGAQNNALTMQACQTGRSQTWQFINVSGAKYKIIAAAAPSLAWDISGGSTADGSPAILWNYTGSDNQLWTITSEGDGKAHLASVKSGKCLTVTGRAKVPPVQQFTCDNTASQSFGLTQVP